MRAVGNAVGEPGGELLHLADGIAVALVAGDLAIGDDVCGARGFGGLFERDLIDQHLEVGADHAVAVCICRDVVSADTGASLLAVYCAIWRKIQGLAGAARPIITASQ